MTEVTYILPTQRSLLLCLCVCVCVLMPDRQRYLVDTGAVLCLERLSWTVEE